MKIHLEELCYFYIDNFYREFVIDINDKGIGARPYGQALIGILLYQENIIHKTYGSDIHYKEIIEIYRKDFLEEMI